MTHPNTTRLSSRLRLLCGLALLIGLCIMLGGLARPAHAQSTLSVSDCSSDAQLQADVAQANSDNAGDVITFACSGDLKLTSTLSISGRMTLSGSGQRVTLDGGGSLQVLSVNSGSSLTLNTLTIAHGSAPYGQGGGLENFGTVSISNSTFANNSSPCNGGGLENFGTVSISNSTFANNSASCDGGGLENFGTVSITSSTFANNSASERGGGLDSQEGTVTISNSTIANNSGSDGGGLDLWRGRVTISNSTVADNAGGGLENVTGTVSISGSILANTSGNCFSAGGTYIDNGYNLSSGGCITSATSLQANPKLGPLASNGGPTQTMALLKGSPAIDYISLALCPKTDQRGHKRPDNPHESACDIGAFES